MFTLSKSSLLFKMNSSFSDTASVFLPVSVSNSDYLYAFQLGD